MAINQIEKTDYSPVNISYTDKDYINILDDLINSISGISAKWNTTDINDPGMVLVRLMAILGDMLFYNLDLQSLEVYPSSVTQRKNAASIFKLIGYKMRWFKSAVVWANVVNTYTNMATIPRFCTFTTNTEDITYCTFDEEWNLKSNTNNNGFEELIPLVQGIPVTPIRVSSSPYPEVGKAWHTIYGYNYTTDDIINNKIYLKHQNVDQNHIIVIDDTNEIWTLKENIYLTTQVGRFFEFGVDVNDQPYIELIDYYKNFNITKFKIFYIRSAGENGQVYANTLKKISSDVWSRTGTGPDQRVYNVSSFIKFTHFDSTVGLNPETPDEARKNSVLYQNTLDTIITLADFEKAALREEGVANVRACDLTNDPGIKKSALIGDINQDGTIDELDYQLLVDYLANPVENPLTTFQRRLADISQDGDKIGERDLQLLYNYIHPRMWKLGDINQDGVIDSRDLQLLKNYLENPKTAKLSDFQVRLCDVNQDGKVTQEDFDKLKIYLNTVNPQDMGSISNDGDEEIGKTGKITLSTVETLDGFVVKLYVLPTEGYADYKEEDFEVMLKESLREYKILPLTIKVDTHSINKYYWSIKGRFMTKTPLSKDELQTIIININNTLKYLYNVNKTNFNTVINYRDIIETILEVDNRILIVDLDPIDYFDIEGAPITKEQITGSYIQRVPKITSEIPVEQLHYNFTLDNTTILPGSVMIRCDGGQFNLRDNNNGEIFNSENVLQYKGTINYLTGEIDLMFNAPLIDDLVVEYIHNTTNIALYRNLSTQEFYFDSTSLENNDVPDSF